MGQIIVNGNVVGEQNDEIVITPVYDTGILIATIEINGVSTPIYVPNNGGND